MLEQIQEWTQRTELLIGAEKVDILKKAHVLVVGLGGVGAYAAESLVRAGIGKLSLVDGDTVHPTNLNRQLSGLRSACGQAKIQVLADRYKDINPEIELLLYPEFIKDERMIEILKAAPYHYVVDAIDTLSPKIYLLYHSKRLNLPVISAMGAGAKMDPTQIRIADIAQTYQCPLANALRKKLHHLGVYNGIQAVFSAEKVRKESVVLVEDELNKKSNTGTISYMPAIFGLFCASVVIRELTGEKILSDLPFPRKMKEKINFEN